MRKLRLTANTGWQKICQALCSDFDLHLPSRTHPLSYGNKSVTESSPRLALCLPISWVLKEIYVYKEQYLL